MQKRKLGKLGVEIRPIGLGCAAIGGTYTRNGRIVSRGQVDESEVTRAIHHALEHEIQLFDVGNIYGAGSAERLLGKALHGRRQQAILQVKFGASFDEVTRAQIDYEGDFSAEMIRNSLAGSLRRLQTDYIDIYQFQIGGYPKERLPDILAMLNELVSEGKIRSYSYGTGEIAQLSPFVESDHCATAITGHNVLMDKPDLLDYLAKNSVALLAGVPLYMGLLAGNINRSTQFTADDVRHGWDLTSDRFVALLMKLELLRPILSAENRTMAEGALAWLWARHPITIPVPGFKTVAHVQSAIDALEKGPLSPDQMTAIAEVVNSDITD